MKILFLNDGNGFEAANPSAALVDVKHATEEQLRNLEKNQVGVFLFGGSWKKIMEDGGFDFSIIKRGRLSDFNKAEYDLEYKLISGNY